MSDVSALAQRILVERDQKFDVVALFVIFHLFLLIGGTINGSHCTTILLLVYILYIFKYYLLQIKNIIKHWIKYKQGGVIEDGMRKDPYTITIPADEQWDVTASLLTYEQFLRESGQPSEAMDIMILCDNIEQQIQQQSQSITLA
jgi:hypothetical protein